jgi:uncharacterized protein (DUF58 family)
MRLLFIILIPLIVLGIALTGSHILVERLFILIALILLFSYLFAWLGMWGLKGQLKNSGRHNQTGKPFEIEAIVENKILLPKPFVKLRIKTDLQPNNESIYINLPSRGTFDWQSKLIFPQRGYYHLGPLFAEVISPLGLFHLGRKLDLGKDLVICPATVELPLFWAKPQAESVPARNSLLTSEADGVISGVREYIPGDSLNRIHWHSTAHKGKLIVKEFDIDLSEKIWVIPDMNKDFNFGKGIETTEEYIITAAASIVKKYAGEGREVGLIANGNNYHFYPARPGNLNMWRIMETLAAIKANGQIPLHRLLKSVSGQFKGNSIAVIVSASTNIEIIDSVINVKKQGIPLAAVLVDAASFGANISSQNLEMQLRNLNIPTYIIKQGDNLAQVLNSQGKNLSAKFGTKVHYLAW